MAKRTFKVVLLRFRDLDVVGHLKLKSLERVSLSQHQYLINTATPGEVSIQLFSNSSEAGVWHVLCYYYLKHPLYTNSRKNRHLSFAVIKFLNHECYNTVLQNNTEKFLCSIQKY